MLENLINLVKENAGESIINNSEVPNEKNETVVEVTGLSIMDTFKNAVSNGEISQLTSLFNNDPKAAESSQLANNAKSNVITSLIEKAGISPEIASKIATVVVPLVMSKLVSKTNDPNNSSFNIQDMIGSLTGGEGGFDVGSLLGGLTSSDDDDKKGNSMGGIGGALGGLFGK